MYNTDTYKISYKKKVTKRVVRKVDCPMCKGKGRTIVDEYDGFDFIKTHKCVCDYCKSTGKVKRVVNEKR